MNVMTITRKKPDLLFSLPRLINRLSRQFPGNERSELENYLYKIQAGYSGELKVDKYLASVSHLASKTILTDVRLPLKSGSSFQIDTLIISKKYILVLEVKNIKGNLYFKTNPHYLLRKLGETETMMECPVTQLELAKLNLDQWLQQYGINTNVHGEIVLASKSAFIKEIPNNSPVTYLKRLSLSLLEKEDFSEVFDYQQVQNIIQLIERHQIKYQPLPLCEYFNINIKSLKLGQLCVHCSESTIYKTERTQHCPYCKTDQPNNFWEPIKDWFLLVDKFITNAQCRYFLGLKNKQDANYKLNLLELNKQGSSVNTRYFCSYQRLFKDN